MTTTMTLRELANNPKLLDKYDKIQVIDKRKKINRGVYLSELEARKYEKLLQTVNKTEKIKDIKYEKKVKKQEETQSFFEAMKPFIGIGNSLVGDMTKEEMRERQYAKYL